MYALMLDRAMLFESGETGFNFSLTYLHDEMSSQSWWTTQFSGLVGLPRNVQFEFSLPYSADADGGSGAWGDVWMGLAKAFMLPHDRNSLINLFAGRTFPSATENSFMDAGLSFSHRADPMVVFGGLTALWPLPAKLPSYELVINMGSELALTPETALSASLAIGRQPPPREGDNRQTQKRLFATVDFSFYKVLTRNMGLSMGLGVKAIGDVPNLRITLAVPMVF
jgi:hypothetical protein